MCIHFDNRKWFSINSIRDTFPQKQTKTTIKTRLCKTLVPLIDYISITQTVVHSLYSIYCSNMYQKGDQCLYLTIWRICLYENLFVIKLSFNWKYIFFIFILRAICRDNLHCQMVKHWRRTSFIHSLSSICDDNSETIFIQFLFSHLKCHPYLSISIHIPSYCRKYLQLMDQMPNFSISFACPTIIKVAIKERC